jgi:hypothetical protein
MSGLTASTAKQIRKAPIGIEYSKLGSRKGNASVIETNNVIGAIEQRNRNLGHGAYTVGYFDDQGQPLSEAVMEKLGLPFTPNQDGKFRVVDVGYLKEIKRETDRINEHVNKVLPFCVSDQITCKILNISQDQLEELCDQGNGHPDMPKALRDFNGMPSFLDGLPPNNLLWSQGMAKLRWVVKLFFPMLSDYEEETKESVVGRRDIFRLPEENDVRIKK